MYEDWAVEGVAKYASHYAGAADWCVFVALFCGPLVLILNRFVGRAKAFVASFGVALLLGGAVLLARPESGRTLNDLGGFSVFLLLLFIALVWTFVGRNVLRLGWFSSLALGYALGYGAFVLAMPGPVNALGDAVPFFSLVALLAFPASVTYALIAAGKLLPGGQPQAQAWLKNEAAVAKQVGAVSGGIVALLDETERAIASRPNDPRRALFLARPLVDRMSSARRSLEAALEELKLAGSSLEDLDCARFSALHHRVAHLPRSLQRVARRELAKVRRRLRVDQRERDLVAQVAANTTAFAHELDNVVKALDASHTGKALRHVRVARQVEREAMKLSLAIAAQTEMYGAEASRAVTRASLAGVKAP
jgi:hypothetical protein